MFSPEKVDKSQNKADIPQEGDAVEETSKPTTKNLNCVFIHEAIESGVLAITWWWRTIYILYILNDDVTMKSVYFLILSLIYSISGTVFAIVSDRTSRVVSLMHSLAIAQTIMQVITAVFVLSEHNSIFILVLIGVNQIFPTDSQLEVYKSSLYTGRQRTIFLTNVEITRGITKAIGAAIALFLYSVIPTDTTDSQNTTKLVFGSSLLMISANNLVLLLITENYEPTDVPKGSILTSTTTMRITIFGKNYIKWTLVIISIALSVGVSAYNATGLSYFLTNDTIFGEVSVQTNLLFLTVFNIIILVAKYVSKMISSKFDADRIYVYGVLGIGIGHFVIIIPHYIGVFGGICIIAVSSYFAGISYISWMAEVTIDSERAKWISVLNWIGLFRSVVAVGAAYLISYIGLVPVFITSSVFIIMLSLVTSRITYKT